HLVEKVGPKAEKKERPKETAASATAKKTGTTTTTSPLTGPKRIKEVELVSAETAAARDTSKKRVLEKQSTVFRSTDYLKRELVHATKKRKVVASRAALKTQITTPAEHKRIIEMAETITVSN